MTTDNEFEELFRLYYSGASEKTLDSVHLENLKIDINNRIKEANQLLLAFQLRLAVQPS
jgi:hypothetical protein